MHHFFGEPTSQTKILVTYDVACKKAEIYFVGADKQGASLVYRYYLGLNLGLGKDCIPNSSLEKIAVGTSRRCKYYAIDATKIDKLIASLDAYLGKEPAAELYLDGPRFLETVSELKWATQQLAVADINTNPEDFLASASNAKRDTDPSYSSNSYPCSLI